MRDEPKARLRDENQELKFNQPQAPEQINNSKECFANSKRTNHQVKGPKTERGIDWANSRHFDCANKV